LRVYVIARGFQATEIDTAEAARQFAAWLADDAHEVLTEIIQRWLWQPPDAGGLGAVAESVSDIAALRAEFVSAAERGLPAIADKRAEDPSDGQVRP
jgi:hypothetical protein